MTTCSLMRYLFAVVEEVSIKISCFHFIEHKMVVGLCSFVWQNNYTIVNENASGEGALHAVGRLVFSAVIPQVGAAGTSIGSSLGTSLGSSLGTSLGSSLGTSIGSSLGTSLGACICNGGRKKYLRKNTRYNVIF